MRLGLCMARSLGGAASACFANAARMRVRASGYCTLERFISAAAIERTSYWLIPGFAYIYYKSRSLTAFHRFLVFLLPFGRWHSSGIVVFCWFWPLSIALFHRFNRRLDRSMKGAE